MSKGPRARARPPWWLIVVTAAFAIYFGLLIAADLRRPQVAGFTLVAEATGMRVTAVAQGSPADAAGVRPGDGVAAANGRSIRTRLDWEAFEGHLTAPANVSLELTRGAQRVPVALRLERIEAGYWTTQTGATLAVARAVQLVTLLLAIVIVARRPFGRAARLGAWLLASMAVFSIALPYGLAALWNALPFPVGLLVWLPHASSLAVAPIMLTFVAGFPRPRLHSPIAWLALWLPAVPMLVLRLDGTRAIVDQVEPLWQPDGLQTIVAVTLGAYAAATIVSVARAYRQEHDVTARRRLRIATFGFVTGLLGMTPIVIAQARGSAALNASVFTSPLVTAGTLIGLAWPLSFTYVILRHRLFDVSFIVRRSLQYALARGVVLSVVPVALAVFLLDLLVNRHVPVGSVLQERGWLYAGVAGLATLARARRHVWLNGLDRKFFRERYNAQQLLRSIAEDLERTPAVAAAAPRVVAQIEAALHPAVVALMIRNAGTRSYECIAAAPVDTPVAPLEAPSTIAGLLPLLQRPLRLSIRSEDSMIRQLTPADLDWVRQHRVELIVPVHSGSRAVDGFFALGARRSEEPYSVEDEDLLATVGHAVALIPPREPADGFDECPACGHCYATGTASCSRDGSSLAHQALPRTLDDRYRLNRRIGRGGMGTVYAADDGALHRQVAVKVLADDLRDPAAAGRFRVEAQSAAALSHPNVVTVYDICVSPGGRAFFVMELLEGVPLDQELRRAGRFEPERTLRLFKGICAAVRMAHTRQIVHRDLKPQNIFLCAGESGEMPKVLDFGLAKALAITRLTTLTQQGMVLGTLRYMSPEQLRGEQASVDGDLWALALIALEMLAGSEALDRPPGLAPALDSLQLSPSLRHAFGKVLSPDPLDRPASVDELLESIERALTTPGEPA